MLIGCGIDIEEINRFSKYFANKDDSEAFFNFVYSEEELKNYRKYSAEICLPLSFTCKEAFFKALGISWNNSPIDWKDIQLHFNGPVDTNKPVIKTFGYAKKILNQKKVNKIDFDFTINENYSYFEIILLNTIETNERPSLR